MCLFPGMLGGQQQQNDLAPPEVKKHQCNLYILAILHFACAIMLCIAIPPLSFGEIITAMILMCTAYAMNFCMIILYMLFMMQDVVQYFSAVGLLIQNGELGPCYRKELPNKCDPFSVTVIIIFFVFSVASIVVGFHAYRIFKAYAMGQLGAGGGNGMFLSGMNMPAGRGGRRNNRDRDDDEEAP